MKRFTSSCFALLLQVFAIVALTACQMDEGDTPGRVTKVKVGDEVPEFVVTATDGQTLSPSSLRGGVYVLNFFDTGCPDCQKEFPVLQQIYDKYGDSVAVINVPRSQSVSEVVQYWSAESLTMPVYSPRDKDLYYRFADSGIPLTYVVDGKGVVQAVFTDSPLTDFNTFDIVLRQLLQTEAEAKDMVRLTLRLNVPATTRSADDAYFQNEHTISRLEVFFFDAQTGKLYSKAVVDDLTKDDDSFDKTYDATYLMKDIRIHAGVYHIFAIANYHHIPDDITDLDDFLNLTDSITYQSGIEPNIPSQGCVMTNRATELLNVNLIPWANNPYVLAIDMERVLAKLQIGVAKNNFELKHNDRKYADLNITNYKLVNLNRQYYLFQHKDAMSDLGRQPDFRLPDNYADCDEQDGQYIVDPYFYSKTSNQRDAAKFKDIYASWYGAFTTENFASIPAAGNYGYVYILENTSFRTSQKNGYSPGIIFKAAVSPLFVYLYDDKTHTLVEEYRAEYWSHTIYLYNYNFYGSIQAVNVASGLRLDELETYTDAQLKTYGIKQCKFNMGVYETFYTYWIRHRNNTDDPMASMGYGVVRNNYYKIVVSGVSGIGNSEILPEIMRDNYPNTYTDVVVE